MSFDNLNINNSEKEIKANLFFLIVLTIFASIAMIFIPFLNFIAFAFICVPPTLLLILNRIRDFAICAVAGIIVFLLFNYVISIVLLIVIVSVSFCYKYFLAKRIKILIILSVIFLIFLLSVFLFFLVDSAVIQKNSFSETLNFYNSYIEGLDSDPILQNYRNSIVINKEQFNEVLTMTKSFFKFLPKILPGFFIVIFGAASILNYIFSYSFLKKYSLKIEQLPVFKEWDLPWYWCWGVIVGIILIIIPSFTSTYSNIISIFGYNLLIISGFVYFILGLSVLWSILDRFNVKTYIRVLIIIAMFLFLGLFIFLPVLGLIDIWANFRKLKRVH